MTEFIIDCQHPDNVYPVFMSIELITGIRPALGFDSSSGVLCAVMGTRFLHIYNLTEDQRERMKMAVEMVARQLNIKLVDVSGLPKEHSSEDDLLGV